MSMPVDSTMNSLQMAIPQADSLLCRNSPALTSQSFPYLCLLGSFVLNVRRHLASGVALHCLSPAVAESGNKLEEHLWRNHLTLLAAKGFTLKGPLWCSLVYLLPSCLSFPLKTAQMTDCVITNGIIINSNSRSISKLIFASAYKDLHQEGVWTLSRLC